MNPAGTDILQIPGAFGKSCRRKIRPRRSFRETRSPSLAANVIMSREYRSIFGFAAGVDSHSPNEETKAKLDEAAAESGTMQTYAVITSVRVCT